MGMTPKVEFDLPNPLLKKLQAGASILGTWTIIPSPINIEIIGSSGFDFQILDLEHGVFDLQSLENCIRSCESTGCSPLVRAPGILPHIVQNALDFGAHGIIFPQIKDAVSAQEALKALSYPPEGIRGYNPFTRAGNYHLGSTKKLSNNFPLSSVIIENLKAYHELDKILEIKNLDVVYLGAYDMSVALDCAGDIENSKIQDFLNDSISRIRKAKKHAGVMVKNKEDIEKFNKLGANVLVYGVDTQMISTAAKNAKQLFDSTLKII